MKVIGAGHGRTGTTSLQEALELLGFGKCYHAEVLFADPSGIVYWKELVEKGTTNFDELFDGFQSMVDYPGALKDKVF
jgi:hypothetical protein